MGIVNPCRYCRHPEAQHGPISGRGADGVTIPGRFCYHGENTGDDLCFCSGFNTIPWLSAMEVLNTKLGGNSGKSPSEAA